MLAITTLTNCQRQQLLVAYRNTEAVLEVAAVAMAAPKAPATPQPELRELLQLPKNALLIHLRLVPPLLVQPLPLLLRLQCSIPTSLCGGRTNSTRKSAA